MRNFIVNTVSFLRPLFIQLISVKRGIYRLIGVVKTATLFPNSLSLRIHHSVEIKHESRITFGDNVRVGPGCSLGGYGGITFGSNIVVSRGCIIESAGLKIHNGLNFNSHVAKPIKIGDNVWFGANVIVLGGVTIGNNCIIGAGTTVSKDLESNSKLVGQSNRIL